ncbi:hypothetical protein B0J15DRAFT_63295 [Fusarium solani]|uniref:Exonuclease domain-containing protein n=1 Tax=Fusarium solani TaxID=169388 RepID=A0A9P9GZK5_FUSSL|nr:uncharacterized protein B0J15DRAFT_63295 [Fusarium solani]KAH7248449.1 hypothetical protein B0J15DRAFT_63295 [Fusarium solani]
MTPGGPQDEIDTLGLEQMNLEEAPVRTVRCKFPSGKVVNKRWSCCKEHTTAPPCRQEENHQPQKHTPNELSNLWQFHVTPLSSTRDNRKAVVIDCEMGVAASGDSELIRKTLVDYFSGEILVDKLVWPEVSLSHLNTRFSGVTWKSMNAARKQGAASLVRRRRESKSGNSWIPRQSLSVTPRTRTPMPCDGFIPA